MSGNKKGAEKARAKNLKTNPNFYRDIGKLSWQNKERSHITGFALLTPEQRAEHGRNGGKKTKEEYKTFDLRKEYIEAQAAKLAEVDPFNPSVSE